MCSNTDHDWNVAQLPPLIDVITNSSNSNCHDF